MFHACHIAFSLVIFYIFFRLVHIVKACVWTSAAYTRYSDMRTSCGMSFSLSNFKGLLYKALGERPVSNDAHSPVGF